MLETLAQREPALLIPIFSVVGTAVVFVVWIVAHYWYQMRKLDCETSLKKELLQRDFSATDIERVLKATAGDERITTKARA